MTTCVESVITEGQNMVILSVSCLFRCQSKLVGGINKFLNEDIPNVLSDLQE